MKLKEKLQEFGYMKASVRRAQDREVTKTSVLFKKQKMMRLIIPLIRPG
jgi:hypothetical protein